ncbi:hypothetical protein [Cnuella takakiae]|uniref:hypothetical protein n=1 Tax=Cnuella takakiae TaxID=1302690 RepID=UPI0015B62AC7|nr:hypothetical protein [Cnuella takakiae]
MEVEQQLSRLQSAGFIMRYEVGDLKVIQVHKFTKHQRISGTEAKTESELPEYQQENGVENSGSTVEALRKHSGSTLDDRKGLMDNGIMDNGLKEETTAPATPPGTSGDDKTIPLQTEKNSQQPQGTPRRELQHPFSPAFDSHWSRWIGYKKAQHRFTHKGESEQQAISHLVHLSGNDEAKAIRIIDQSIAQGWKGLFELKKTDNGNANNRQPTASGGGAAKGNSAGAARLASMVREQLGAASGA